DSGASEHFTPDINDFVDYQEFTKQEFVKTANSTARIAGKGTILLVLNNTELIRLSPVYHIPSLTCHLLSLGTFLQGGYTCKGNEKTIQIVKGSTPFLTFQPRINKNSLYVLKSIVANDSNEIHMVINSVYEIDYEVLHRRLAHPSREVLLKARKHLKDFPAIDFPIVERICQGCLQGKMTNRPFFPSTKRASQPFELIHSDLKSFPIESYHKYKYVIVFYDDYSSSAWTVNLRTKDAAILATYHFIMMVENRIWCPIIQWKSDPGGGVQIEVF